MTYINYFKVYYYTKIKYEKHKKSKSKEIILETKSTYQLIH